MAVALELKDRASQLSDEELRHAYQVGVRSRALEEHIVRLASRGEVKFAIYGPGEEVHGVATALALHRTVSVPRFGIVPHYRSGALISMWASLCGYEGFSRDVLRQQFSKNTDKMSRGRQMVNHIYLPEIGVLPVQTPVGMQLGKAAGYALGFKKKGVSDAVVVAVIGDGTSAEGDLHEAMNAASVWDLPLMIIITDNGVAISTTPKEGRGIRDFEAYAAGFGIRHVRCDGRDFFATFDATQDAARYVRDAQQPVLLHAHSLPRFNGHSSAADMTFDLTQDDPLIRFGDTLVERQLLAPQDVLRRIVDGGGRDFFAHHALGHVMERENEQVKALFREVRAEPDAPAESVLQNIHPPYPQVREPDPPPHSTNVTYAAAIRSALDYMLAERGGLVYGQDVGRLGGVMQATAGLQARYPDRVVDAPLNEPLIVGTAMGVGLHPGLKALPEIQFGDYSLNAFHWLVYLGNLYWGSNGRAQSRLILRMPVDPFGGGAMYHSMSLEGYFSAIPGLVLLMPSTSWDAYGLLMTAAEYDGPVVVLEPKWLYRQSLGPAFPGEPTDPEGIKALKKASMRGVIPDLPRDIRVPFGKGVIRRPGNDVTVVAWGRAVWTALDAAGTLAKEGVEAEVIDLRTLVPPDFDLVADSVRRTGRLVVAAEDRSFAGFVRAVQGAIVERLPGVPTRAVGQKNVPGIAQGHHLEEATILKAGDIVAAAREAVGTRTERASAGWAWVPQRYYVS